MLRKVLIFYAAAVVAVTYASCTKQMEVKKEEKTTEKTPEKPVVDKGGATAGELYKFFTPDHDR